MQSNPLVLMSSWIEAALVAHQSTGGENNGPQSDEQPDNGMAPLPDGWHMAVAPDGQNYYFNQDTGQTSWNQPGTESKTSVHERLATPKHVKEGARKVKKAKAPDWNWNAKASLHSADDKYTKEDREKAARESRQTMNDPKILGKVQGLQAHLERRNNGDSARRNQDVTDHTLTAEVGQVSKKTPALFSEAHDFDLYGWNPSTTVREGGTVKTGVQRKIEELQTLPQVKIQENRLKKHPYDLYSATVNRVMDEVRAIERSQDVVRR